MGQQPRAGGGQRPFLSFLRSLSQMQRFSDTEFPSWPLGQPQPMISYFRSHLHLVIAKLFLAYPLVDGRLALHLFLLAGSLPSPTDYPRGLSPALIMRTGKSDHMPRVILLTQDSLQPSSPSTHFPEFLSPLKVQRVVDFPVAFLQAESELSTPEGPHSQDAGKAYGTCKSKTQGWTCPRSS